MTAFYMDPSEAMYHEIRDMVRKNPPPPLVDGKPPPHPVPPDLDTNTYFELLEAVNTLRPNTYSINATWAELSKPLRLTMEEAGYLYNSRRDTFVPFQEKLSRSIKAKMERMRKKTQDALSVAKVNSGTPGSMPEVGGVPTAQQEKPIIPEEPNQQSGTSVTSETSGASGITCSQRVGTSAGSSNQSAGVVSSAVAQQSSASLLTENTTKVTSDELQVQMEMTKLALQNNSGVSSAMGATENSMISSEATKLSQQKHESKVQPAPGTSQEFALLSEDAPEMPFMDITLDEIQQVLDNSSQGKDHPLSQETTSDKDIVAVHQVAEVESKESSEELVLNTIKEFLKEGDVNIQNTDHNITGDDLLQSDNLPGLVGEAELTGTCAPLQPSEDDDPNIFKCKFCGKAYDSMRQRRRHQEWLCRFKINSAAGEKDIEKQKLRDEEAPPKDEKGQFLCSLCKASLTTLRSLRRHERRVHNLHIKGGKVMMPSGLSLKNCSVKLDRLEDAPSAKSSKARQTSAGRSKDGISKLMSKKYTSGFFKGSASQAEQKQIGTSNVHHGKPKKSAIRKEDLLRLTSEGDSSETDVDYELVSTFEFDSETGDAQVEIFLPDDRSQAVLCDFCGYVCHNYEDMRNHQQTCQLTPKKSPRKEPKFDMNSPQISSAIAALFQQDQPKATHSSAENQASLVPACPNADNFRNLLHAIPQANYSSPKVGHSSGQAKVNASPSKAAPIHPSVQSAMHISTQSAKPQTMAASPKVKPKPKPRKKSQEASLSRPVEKQKNIPPKLAEQPKSTKIWSPNSSQRPKKLIPLSYRICLTCGGEFQNASTCFKHQADMSHFSKGVGLMSKFRCSACSLVFNNAQEGELHMKSHEPQQSESAPTQGSSTASGGTSSSPKKSSKSPAKNKSPSSVPAKGMEVFNSLLVYCPYCQKGFLSQNSLQQHLLIGCEHEVIRHNVPQFATPTATMVQHSSSSMAPVGLTPQIVVTSNMQQNTHTYSAIQSSQSGLQMQIGNDMYVQNAMVASNMVQPIDNVYLGDPATLANQMISFNPTANLLSPTMRVRHEAAVQVNIDEVPFTGAADLPLDTTFDEEDNMMVDDSHYVVAGDVEVEKITFKNVLMLRHKIWLCSHCNKEFALKKDVSQHWETTTCKNKFSAQATDTYNYQCIYCGEMFPEDKDCRDHQFVSCLKDAGMKIQQLKNKHFHCKKEGCKGRYYEKCHVERHLIYFHKVNKDLAAKMVQEWFPDSFVKSISKLLSAKKEAKARSRSPEKREADTSPRQEPGTSTALSSIQEESSSKTSDNLLKNQKMTPNKENLNSNSSSQGVTGSGQSTVVPMATLPQQSVPMSTFGVGQPLPPGYPLYENKPTISMEGISVLAHVGAATGIASTTYPTISNTTPSTSSHVEPLNSSAPPQADDFSGLLAAAPCNSPVPTCNISWSPSSASLMDASPSATPTKARKSRSKTRARDSSADRSSSVESQRSQKSPKQKRVNGKYPVAPAEHHPCPKCGKIIEDRLALQFHMDWTCVLSPAKLQPPKKNRTPSKKREKSPGSVSVSQDSRDSRSVASDDASRSSLTQISSMNIPIAEANITDAENIAVNPEPGNIQHPVDNYAVSSAPQAPTVNSSMEALAVQYLAIQTESNTAQSATEPIISQVAASPDAIPKCNFCGIIFGNSIDLERHVLMMHPQVINYVRCHACNTLCDGLRGLKSHFCVEKPRETEEVLPEDLTMVFKPVMDIPTQNTGTSSAPDISAADVSSIDDCIDAITEEAHPIIPQEDAPADAAENSNSHSKADHIESTIVSVLQDVDQSIESTFEDGQLEEPAEESQTSCTDDIPSQLPSNQSNVAYIASTIEHEEDFDCGCGAGGTDVDSAASKQANLPEDLEKISTQPQVESTENICEHADLPRCIEIEAADSIASDLGGPPEATDEAANSTSPVATSKQIGNENELGMQTDEPHLTSMLPESVMKEESQDSETSECLEETSDNMKSPSATSIPEQIESDNVELCGPSNPKEFSEEILEQEHVGTQCDKQLPVDPEANVRYDEEVGPNMSKMTKDEVDKREPDSTSSQSGQISVDYQLECIDHQSVQTEDDVPFTDNKDHVLMVETTTGQDLCPSGGEISSQSAQSIHNVSVTTEREHALTVDTTLDPDDFELCPFTGEVSPRDMESTFETNSVNIDDAGTEQTTDTKLIDPISASELPSSPTETGDLSTKAGKCRGTSRSCSIDSKASDSSNRRSARGIPRKSYNELEDVDIIDIDHFPPMMKTRRVAAARREARHSSSNSDMKQVSDSVSDRSQGASIDSSMDVQDTDDKQNVEDVKSPDAEKTTDENQITRVTHASAVRRTTVPMLPKGSIVQISKNPSTPQPVSDKTATSSGAKTKPHQEVRMTRHHATDCLSRVAKAMKAWGKPEASQPVKKYGQMSPKASRALASKAKSLDILLNRNQKRMHTAGYFEKMKKVCALQKESVIRTQPLMCNIQGSRPPVHTPKMLQTDLPSPNAVNVAINACGTQNAVISTPVRGEKRDLISPGRETIAASTSTSHVSASLTSTIIASSSRHPNQAIYVKNAEQPAKLKTGPDIHESATVHEMQCTPERRTQPVVKTPTNYHSGSPASKTPLTPFSVKWQTFGTQPRVGNICISVNENSDESSDKTGGKVDFVESHIELQKFVQIVDKDALPDLAPDCGQDDVISQEEDELETGSTDASRSSVVDSHLEDTSSEDVNEPLGRYACPFCDEECSFMKEPDLIAHLKTVHGLNKDEFYDNKTEALSCPVCKDHPSFADELLLHFHMRATHNIANYKVRNKSRSQSIEPVTNQPKGPPSACSDSQDTQDMDSASSISGSSLGSDMDNGISLNGTFQKEHPSLTAKIADPRRTCVICNIAFLKTKHFRMHMSRFHKDVKNDGKSENIPVKRYFKCTLCAHTFGTNEAWKVHYDSHTNGGKRKLTAEDWNVLKSQSMQNRGSGSEAKRRPTGVGTVVRPKQKSSSSTHVRPTQKTSSSTQRPTQSVFKDAPLHVKAPITYSKRDNANRLTCEKTSEASPQVRTITIKRLSSNPGEHEQMFAATKIKQEQEDSDMNDCPIKQISAEQCQKTYEKKFREKSENAMTNKQEEQSSTRRVVKKRRCSCSCDEDKECQKVTLEKQSAQGKPKQHETNTAKTVQADGRTFVTRRSDVTRDKTVGVKSGMSGKWCVWEHFLRSTLKKQSSTAMKKLHPNKSSGVAPKQSVPVTAMTNTHTTRSCFKRKSMSPEPPQSREESSQVKEPYKTSASTETCQIMEASKSSEPERTVSSHVTPPIDEGVVPGTEPMERQEIGYDSEQSVPETRSGLRRRRSTSIGSCTTTTTMTSRRLSTESLTSNSTCGNKQSVSSGSRCSSPNAQKRKKVAETTETNSDVPKRDTRRGNEKTPIRTRSSTSGPTPRNYRKPERLSRSAVTMKIQKR